MDLSYALAEMIGEWEITRRGELLYALEMERSDIKDAPGWWNNKILSRCKPLSIPNRALWTSILPERFSPTRGNRDI
jgi:hypothetical protein